ncbi:hypothetical protein H2248_011188 [Termitomyces sp. 'cryptogamus']|nr:hypothetical protein H2248_011188 [Termitomyces sp. 'cryptogamus']
MQKEDPGKLVLMGYSPGSTSDPSQTALAHLTPSSIFPAKSRVNALFALANMNSPSRIWSLHLLQVLWVQTTQGRQCALGDQLRFTCQLCRAIHHEHRPHQFAIAWRTSRNKKADPGAHFPLAKFGIRMRSAPNTLVAWKPRQPHGTSLPDFYPWETNPELAQRGLSFVTSSFLTTSW